MIIYSGYLTANSGMAEAARAYVRALHDAGEEVTTEIIPNIKSTVPIGENLELSLKLNKNIEEKDFDIKIIHVTPDCVTKHFIPNHYHIFHLFWETNKLTPEWSWALNLCDEIWTGTKHNKEVFRKSGVVKPITVIPQPSEIKQEAKLPIKYDSKDPKIFDGFIFYSIFQWIERKDPRVLLEAFWREFNKDEKVALFIKTYVELYKQEENVEIIKQITEMKTKLGIKNPGKVWLYLKPMSYRNIANLHRTGDCYVTTDRGEGWGRTIAESLLSANPTICTNLGGIREHIPQELFYPLDYKMVNVFNMDKVPWYTEDQKWAQVDINSLRKRMREVFENKLRAKQRGLKARRWAEKKLNYKQVGKLMRNRINQIRKEREL